MPTATPLYEPKQSGEATLVGVATRDVDVIAKARNDGWWMGCVPSPWGDLVFQFQVR